MCYGNGIIDHGGEIAVNRIQPCDFIGVAFRRYRKPFRKGEQGIIGAKQTLPVDSPYRFFIGRVRDDEVGSR